MAFHRAWPRACWSRDPSEAREPLGVFGDSFISFGRSCLRQWRSRPPRLSENFVRIGAEIGVLPLLFMLGLEYTGDELKKSLRLGITAGVIDFVLNFTPGVAAGLLFRWRLLPAVLLGGITYFLLRRDRESTDRTPTHGQTGRHWCSPR